MSTSDDMSLDAGVEEADASLDAADATDSSDGMVDPDASSGPRCNENEYVGDGGCVPCPPGTQNESGDDPAGADTSCEPVLCPVGAAVQDHVCVPCDDGFTTPGETDASGDDASCVPVTCAVAERVEDHACVPCPPGMRNPAGDDASGPDTTCEPVICDVDEYVLNHFCRECTPGTENSAGDDASGADTDCDASACASDRHVVSGVCVDCPDGSTNVAGDDPTGPDTTCDPTICAEDERVFRNECVPCADGTTRPAGDDATGPDTDCSVIPCSEAERVENNSCVPCLPGSTNEAGDNPASIDTECDADLVDVYSSSTTICALLSTGGPECWGLNTGGGNLASFSGSPIPLYTVPSGVVQMGLGSAHACLLRDTGRVECWSSGSATGSWVPGDVGGFPADVAFVTAQQQEGLAVLDNNDVYEWSRYTSPTRKFALRDAPVELESTRYSSCVRFADGSVECWGSNSWGQLGNGGQSVPAGQDTVTPTGLDSGVVELDGAGLSYCAIVQNGDVLCWGTNFYGQLGDGTTTDRDVPTKVVGLPSPAVDVSTSGDHTCAILSNGELWCWGENRYGELGDDTHTRSATPVKASTNFTTSPLQSVHTKWGETCVRVNDLELWCWSDYAAPGTNPPVNRFTRYR